jgi:hypothetical protein
MALLTIGTYAVPAPLKDSYEVTTEPVMETHENVARVKIGEFVRWRRRIRWSYARLSAANNYAIASAMKINTPGTSLQAVEVTYWDPDMNSFQVGNFIAGITSPKFNRFDPSARYTDVNFELNEQ